jgi:hypothetical protein
MVTVTASAVLAMVVISAGAVTDGDRVINETPLLLQLPNHVPTR